MTAFVKENFSYHGGYLTYRVGNENKFVARFKYKKGEAGPWMTFLKKNFTVEEYFARREAGEAPLNIVESKGYIMAHIKRWANSARPEEREAGLGYIARVHEKMKATA